MNFGDNVFASDESLFKGRDALDWTDYDVNTTNSGDTTNTTASTASPCTTVSSKGSSDEKSNCPGNCTMALKSWAGTSLILQEDFHEVESATRELLATVCESYPVAPDLTPDHGHPSVWEQLNSRKWLEESIAGKFAKFMQVLQVLNLPSGVQRLH